MSRNLKSHKVEQQFHLLVQSGAHIEALDLITREWRVFPEHAQKVTYYWRMAMACRLKDKDLALHLLKEAVQAGYWYAGLDADPDFQLLCGNADFEQLTRIGMELRAQAMANVVPVIKTLQPNPKYSPYPLLLALHGSNANVENQTKHWNLAVDHGWLVALPQSSQVFGQDKYTWNDWEWSQQEVCERYKTLCNEYPIDLQRVVLAGFSQGGGLALWLVLAERLRHRD